MEREVRTTKARDDHMRIFLQPIAAASILGLFAFAGATFVVGAQYAGWYSGLSNNVLPGAFAGVFGGIAQLMAAMWAYKNRDGLSTAFHGVWGAFWLAFGIQNFIMSMGLIPGSAHSAVMYSMGYWWIAMAWISIMCAAAALATNFALFGVMAVVAGASIAMTVGTLTSSTPTLMIGGYLLVVSAVFAWYTSGAMMLEDAFGHQVLPVGEFRVSAEEEVVSDGVGEPGVLHGQWGAFGKKEIHHRAGFRTEVDRRPPAEA